MSLMLQMNDIKYNLFKAIHRCIHKRGSESDDCSAKMTILPNVFYDTDDDWPLSNSKWNDIPMKKGAKNYHLLKVCRVKHSVTFPMERLNYQTLAEASMSPSHRLKRDNKLMVESPTGRTPLKSILEAAPKHTKQSYHKSSVDFRGPLDDLMLSLVGQKYTSDMDEYEPTTCQLELQQLKHSLSQNLIKSR